MHIDTDRLDEEYPPEPECQVNEKNCVFEPISYLCHDCGKRMCANCATGVRHQPHMFKYSRSVAQGEDRTQMHCRECADKHDINSGILKVAGAAVLVGAALLYFTNPSGPILAVAAGLLVTGGYVGYKEYNLKKNLTPNQIT